MRFTIFGNQDDVSYAVMELLEDETLLGGAEMPFVASAMKWARAMRGPDVT